MNSQVDILLTAGYAQELVDEPSIQKPSELPMLKKPCSLATLRATLQKLASREPMASREPGP